jgi:PKD repeat protein
LTYTWSFLTKPCDSAAALSNSHAVSPTFTADKEGTYRLQLSVDDGHGGTDTDEVLINAGGLVARWKLDEGAGTTASDCSGNGNDGVIHGAAWADGKIGKALSFDGQDDYVEVPDSDSLDVTHLTIVAWIYPRSYPPHLYHAGIVGKGGYDMRTGYETLLSYAFGQGGEAKTFELDTNWDQMNCGPIPANTWTHAAATYDGALGTLFVNGVQRNQESLAAIVPNSSDLYIGVRTPGNAFVAYFDGIIDEIRIYNRALSASEIQDLWGGSDLQVDFNYSPSCAAAGTVLTFTDTSSGDSPMTAWLWSFGDGQTSTQQNPTHTYATSGTFTVTLQATGGSGASGTASKEIHVCSLGDLTGDGKVNVADVLMLYRAINGLLTLTPCQQAQADIDKDGNVDLDDGVALVHLVTG